MLKKFGLAKKLTVLTVILMASSLIFTAALIYFSVLNFGNSFLLDELSERTSIIERSFAEPLWNYDKVQLVEVGNSMLIDGKYIYLRALKVENSSGEVLFEKGMSRTNISFNEAIIKPFTKSRIIKIVREGQEIGTVSIAITNEGYIQTIRSQLLRVLAVSLSVLCVVSLMVRFYFNKLLTIPLNKILTHVRAFERQNYKKCETTDLPEELETIANSLNEAWALVKQRNDDLMGYTDDLELLVLERTAELEGQIAKNMNAARLVAVGEMAADVAHEINNPLTIIDLHVNRIKKINLHYSSEPNKHDVLASIEKIQSMVSRIVKIIKGLKSLARDGNNDPMMNFSVASMLEEVKVLVDMKIKGQEIAFISTLNDQDAYVIGREVQISQVLVNLINNSVDAISQLPERWVKLEVRAGETNVRFIITDSGNGIPVELQENIMRPFFTTKGAHKGTGLGLSISKNIIEEHEGHFLYNADSKNTQFIFTLKRGMQVQSQIKKLAA